MAKNTHQTPQPNVKTAAAGNNQQTNTTGQLMPRHVSSLGRRALSGSARPLA